MVGQEGSPGRGDVADLVRAYGRATGRQYSTVGGVDGDLAWGILGLTYASGALLDVVRRGGADLPVFFLPGGAAQLVARIGDAAWRRELLLPEDPHTLREPWRSRFARWGDSEEGRRVVHELAEDRYLRPILMQGVATDAVTIGFVYAVAYGTALPGLDATTIARDALRRPPPPGARDVELFTDYFAGYAHP